MQSQTTPAFALAPADFDRLMKVFRRRVRRGRRLPQAVFFVRLLSGASIVASMGIFVWLVQENEELARPLETLIGLLFFAIAVALAAPLVSQALVRSRIVSQRGEFLAPRAIEFSESGLVIVSTLRRTEIRWEGVLAREEDAANYYLFIDEIQAVVVPRSSVAQFLPQFEQYTDHLKNAA
jgi:hypothetical protein